MKTDQNPFRKGSKLARIFAALAKSMAPMTASEVSRKTKINIASVKLLLAACRNPRHNSVLRRTRYRVELDKGKGLYRIIRARPEKSARREPRERPD